MSIQILTHKPDSRVEIKQTQFFAKNDEKLVLEQGLPGIALEGSWQSGSGRALLLDNGTQAVAPLMANRVQAVAPLIAYSTCAVPWSYTKHKENDISS